MQTKIKEKVKTAIAFIILVILIFIAIVITYKYNVEGETNMPFKLSKIVIGSMVVSSDNPIANDVLENEIVQNNGIYFEIKKNEKYEKEATIKSIEINNIQIIRKPQKGDIKVYMPNTTENKKFTYSDNYILEGNSLTYKGASRSDTTNLEINNQGGIIGIAFGNNKLGTYNIMNEETIIDGTMLKNMNITDEDIKFTVNFDFIINTNGKKYKTNIKLDLPPEEITKTGKSSLEVTNTSKYIFKREK
ncbi:MAG: hypothetical protein HFJ42_01200 [Clostridia bacterium]|nr:hypothetical protein [Clostridia bacterium]